MDRRRRILCGMIGRVLWLVAAVLLANHVHPVHAQNGGTLPFDETVTDTLDDASFRHLYAFDGLENEVVSLTMIRVSGDLDPYLLLTDETGSILALSDDHGASTNAEIPFQRLPADGRYFVIATRFGQELGVTAGDYRLLLERVGAEVTKNTTLEYGQSIFGRIANDEPIAFYFLRAERGDVINVAMRRTSGDLDPQIELATTDGSVLVTNDDDPDAEGTLDAKLKDYLIYDDGTYLVVTTRFGREAGDTEGSYVLTASVTPPEALGTSFANARLIDYGDTLSGTVDDTTPIRYFQFQGRRGDVITVTATNETGNLNPVLKLADSTHSELVSDDDSGTNRNARIAAFTLPATDTYYLLATRFAEVNGQTDGTFSLQLSGRPGIVGGRALEIVYGVSLSGQIDDENPAEEYIFFGEQGDQIRITMERASDDLDALITLLDQDRKQIAFDDDSGEDKDARIERFTLPSDGVYILVASRYEREQGTSSGAYILSLDLLRSGS